jgi:DNA-directed RNA polymerase subunit RPC12/RpoP
MSTEPKSKAAEPIACSECGQFWTTDIGKKNQLCIQCSRPMSNQQYLARIRHRHIDQGGTGLGEAHDLFMAATHRHFRQ